MQVVSNGCQEIPIFRLGAFIFPPESQQVCWDRRPVMAFIPALSLHQAQRIFVQDVLAHGLFVREIHILTEHLEPFNQEVWEISS